MMSSLYVKKTLKQLKALALERGIEYQGLKKAEIIDELVVFDENDVEDSEVVIVNKIVATKKNAPEVGYPNIEVPAGKADSEQMLMLKLQLQIEETKLKQMQLGSNGQNAIVGQSSDVNVISQLKNRLPVMPQDGDIMNFFANFERCMELNDVFDKNIYAQCLPMVLSTRASAIYAQLTFEQAKSYDVCKAFLITTFRKTSEFYLESVDSHDEIGLG